MANGFKALRHVGGGVARLSQYTISAAAPAIFNGDIVKLVAGNILAAVTNELHAGSFVGCMYLNAKGEQKFSPDWPADTAATEITGLINEDSNVSYAVTDSSGALTVGALCDLDTAVAGDASTGASRMAVKASVNGDFKVRSIVDATNNIVEVVIV